MTASLLLDISYVKSQNYKDAIDLLHSGALLLLKHKQVGSGTDLGLYLIEVYNLDKVPVSEESRGRMTSIEGTVDKDLATISQLTEECIYFLDGLCLFFWSVDRIFDLAELMDAENGQRKAFLQSAIR